MQTKISLAAIAVVLLLCSACKKETTTPGSSSVKDFFSSAAVQSQSFTVNATNYQQIVGAKNTHIVLYPGSLLDQNGHVVTGNVQVELKELYSKGDMIRSNATTTSGNLLLQSGGEIYLKIRQGNQELRVNPAIPLQIAFPTNNPSAGMQLFYGGFAVNDAVAADSVLNWNVACTCTTANAFITVDSFSSVQFYDFWTVDSLGWTNCDRFYNLTGGTDVSIELAQGFDDTNTSVYMIFDAENSVASADLFSNQIFRFHSGEHTPIGINVTIVAICKKDGQYYYGIQHKVTAAGVNINVPMTAATEAQITTALDAL
jgi:hypothetical protein